jgi:hypothetical protein
MNRSTFITMSTLIFTILAYVTLAQTADASEALASGKASRASVVLANR